MQSNTATIPYGTLVRVTETHQLGENEVFKGTEFIAYDFAPAGDPTDGYLPFDWYSGYQPNEYYAEAAADKLEVVKTAEQLAARRIPTAEKIIRALHCLDDYATFSINAADAPEGASRELSGVTNDGLPFAFTITVSNIYQAD